MTRIQNKTSIQLTHSELTANPTRYGLVANTSSLDEKTQNKCDKLKARLEKKLDRYKRREAAIAKGKKVELRSKRNIVAKQRIDRIGRKMKG